MIRIMIIGIILLFIAGCGGEGGPGISKTIEDIKKGTDGLVLEFGENAPPKEVYEGEMFPVSLLIHNKGAYDIERGAVVSINFDDNLLEIDEGVPRETLRVRGRSIGNPRGDTQYMDLTLIATEDIGPQMEAQEAKITALACYEYEARLVEGICIDTSTPGEATIDKACEVKDITSSGQGGPVAITRVEVEVRPGNDNIVMPYLTVHIQNKGDGDVVHPDAIAALCGVRGIRMQDAGDDLDKVYIEGMLSGEDLDCRGVVKLEGGKGEVRCTVPDGFARNFVTYVGTLELRIVYGYTAMESEEVLVKKRN